jgi:hypothetical protein
MTTINNRPLRKLAYSIFVGLAASSAVAITPLTFAQTAAPATSSKAIVVRDSPTNAMGFTFKANKAEYKKLEAIRFTAKADQDFYLYVYNANPSGTATLIYPNKKEPAVLLKKGVEHSLPKRVEFAADGALKTERLIVIATAKKIDIATAQMKDIGDFMSGDEGALVDGMEAKGIIIRDRPTPPPASQAAVVRTVSLAIK